MARHWKRRAFLGTSVAGLLSTAAHLGRPALAAGTRPQTFTYKTVGDCHIKADVYNASPETKQPIAVWIHGGALIMGDRRGIDQDAAG